jgi:hypothetical protein
MIGLTSADARDILETLAQYGIPPNEGTEAFTEGFGPALDAFDQRYFKTLLPAGKSGFKLVQARYGGGKTHFLFCLRDLALERGFAASLVNLAPGACAYDRPIQVYRAIADRLEVRIDGVRVTGGVDQVLLAHMEHLHKSLGEDEARAWLAKTVRHARIDSQSFRAAVYAFGRACLDGEVGSRDMLGAYLRGEQVPSGNVKPFGVFARMSNATAFCMLRSLSQILREIGFGGVAFLFDEVDRILSVRRSSASARAFTDNLRDIIDLVGRHELPGALFVYAVPGEDFWRLVSDYQALHERLRPPLLNTGSLLWPVIDLEHLSVEEGALLKGIGRRLCDLHGLTNGGGSEGARQNLERLASLCAERVTDRGNRRLFVKSAAALLVSDDDATRALDEQDLRNLIRRNAAAGHGE